MFVIRMCGISPFDPAISSRAHYRGSFGTLQAVHERGDIMVANRQDLEGQILAGLRALSDEALAEVVQFLEYQRYKAEMQEQPHDTSSRPVKLGGMWTGHDLSEAEIDQVRREIWAGFGDRDL
jgi:hypothetical protein